MLNRCRFQNLVLVNLRWWKTPKLADHGSFIVTGPDEQQLEEKTFGGAGGERRDNLLKLTKTTVFFKGGGGGWIESHMFYNICGQIWAFWSHSTDFPLKNEDFYLIPFLLLLLLIWCRDHKRPKIINTKAVPTVTIHGLSRAYIYI